MKKPYPCLWFSTEALDAAKYYVAIFKNTKQGAKLGTVKRYDDPRTGKKNQVITAAFKVNGQEFLALNGRPPDFAFNDATSFVVTCENQREIDTLWKKLLANGGEESMCGWLKDKFGVSWQIIPENLDKLLASPEAMQAMFSMRKLDIKALEAAGGVKAKSPAKKKTAKKKR